MYCTETLSTNYYQIGMAMAKRRGTWVEVKAAVGGH
jgi:ribonucleotide reductase alpha subunit